MKHAGDGNWIIVAETLTYDGPATDGRAGHDNLGMQFVLTFQYEHRWLPIDHGQRCVRHCENGIAAAGGELDFHELARMQTIEAVVDLDPNPLSTRRLIQIVVALNHRAVEPGGAIEADACARTGGNLGG